MWRIVTFSLLVCSELPNVPHAHVSEGTSKAVYQEGDVIHFSCESGYISDQISKFVCTADGWLVVHQGKCYCKLHGFMFLSSLTKLVLLLHCGCNNSCKCVFFFSYITKSSKTLQSWKVYEYLNYVYYRVHILFLLGFINDSITLTLTLTQPYYMLCTPKKCHMKS